MREHSEVHYNRVTVVPPVYSSGVRGPLDVPRDLLETLKQYDLRDLTDAAGALRRIGPNPHYWTTAGEIAQREFTEAVTIWWYEADYDYSAWESMDVSSSTYEDDFAIWFYSDVEELKSYYLDESYEYRNEYLEYDEEEWIRLARADRAFYAAQPVLVVEPHPTLF